MLLLSSYTWDTYEETDISSSTSSSKMMKILITLRGKEMEKEKKFISLIK